MYCRYEDSSIVMGIALSQDGQEEATAEESLKCDARCKPCMPSVVLKPSPHKFFMDSKGELIY